MHTSILKHTQTHTLTHTRIPYHAVGRHVSNNFRTERLYFEEVDIVLKRHQVLLKAIYSRYRCVAT